MTENAFDTDLRPISRCGAIPEGEFESFYSLLLQAFPASELRDRRGQRALFADPRYHAELLLEGAEVVGLATWWALDRFIFAEHYAVRQDRKGRGYGALLMARLKDKGLPLIGEIELPETETAKRRLAMFEHMGFTAYPHIEYYQWPIGAGFDKLPLCLISSRPMESAEMERVKRLIYRQIYGR